MSHFPTFRRLGQSMTTVRFWLLALRRTAVFTLAFSLLGLASNAASSARCTSATRAHMATQFRRGVLPPRLAWLPPASLRNVAHDPRGAFDTSLMSFSNHVGQRYFRERIYLPASLPSLAEPWAFTRAHLFDCPFVVRVYYGFSAEDAFSRSAVLEHLAFFGLRIPIFDDTFFLL